MSHFQSLACGFLPTTLSALILASMPCPQMSRGTIPHRIWKHDVGMSIRILKVFSVVGRQEASIVEGLAVHII